MKKFLALLASATLATGAHATCDDFCHPFYIGVNAGYGATTWQGLVPSPNKQNMAMNISTPIHVTEGGALWGFFIGYEFLPMFALEGSYNHYPNAKVAFDNDSLFTFDNGTSSFTTHTETISLIGKIMLLIPHTKVRAYSSAGVAVIHRWDVISDRNRGTPTFGIGANYNLTDRIMLELGGNYTAGYGESELEPVKDYMPFLYSAFLGLAYRI